MKPKTYLKLLFCFIAFSFSNFENVAQNQLKNTNYVDALVDTLNQLMLGTDEAFMDLHCKSIVDVIQSKSFLTKQDSTFIKDIYLEFEKETVGDNLKQFETYRQRKRQLMISWISPTDNKVSSSWLQLPANWDIDKEYPLYIQLHGLWDVAADPIEYMSYPFLNGPSDSYAFEDGYLLSPWGRGNHWYEGISETDIYECVNYLESLVDIDQGRKYLSGHSMGGYGAWRIGYLTHDTWAALGIHAGAIWWNNQYYLSSNVINTLKDVPVYFVCGNMDGNLTVNQMAYDMLEQAGNKNIEFATFSGGHIYLQSNVENMYSWLRQFRRGDTTGNEREIAKLRSLGLKAYPNYFSESINLEFEIPRTSHVSIKIYDSKGQCVEIIHNSIMPHGRHLFTWSPKNLSHGVYYCKIMSGKAKETCKLLYFGK